MFRDARSPQGLGSAPFPGVYGMPPGNFVAPIQVRYLPLFYALDFDGVNDRAEAVVSLGAFTGFTFMCWWVPTNAAASTTPFTTNAALNIDQFLFRTFGSGLAFSSYGPTGTETFIPASGSMPTSGVPYHVAFTVSSSYVVRMFVNGVGVSVPTPIPVGNRPSAISRFQFGSSGVGTSPFAGRISGCSIFDFEYTPDQIYSAFSRRTIEISQQAQALAYYPFDQLAPTATQTPDISGNGRHLTLVNMITNPIVQF